MISVPWTATGLYSRPVDGLVELCGGLPSGGDELAAFRGQYALDSSPESVMRKS